MSHTKHTNTQSNSNIISIVVEVVVDLFCDLIDYLVSMLIKIVEIGINKLLKKDNGNMKVNQKDISCKKVSNLSADLGYSVTKKRAFKLSELDTKRHNLIIGSSGWGKSNLIKILMENDLKENRSIISLDPKASLDSIKSFERVCKHYDKKCYIFSEHYSGYTKINPLKGLGVTECANLIMRAFKWENEYYRSESESALINTIIQLNKKSGVITLKKILAKLKERSENKDKISGLIVNLERIVHSSFGKLFEDESGEAKTLKDIRDEQACLYIGLSTAGFGEVAKGVGKIFLCSLLHHSYEWAKGFDDPRAAMSNPISVYFDELGSIIVPDFIDLINKCRSSGIRLTSAVQSLADIDEVSVNLKRQVWDNCNNVFVQKQSSHVDSEYISKSIGTWKTKKLTSAVQDGLEVSDGSSREVYEYFCHPNRLTEIKQGQCVLLRHNPKDIDFINIRNAETSIAFTDEGKPQVDNLNPKIQAEKRNTEKITTEKEIKI